MTESSTESDRKLRFLIRLLVRHPNIDTALISEGLGMIPNVLQRMGANRETPNGELLEGKYHESRWGWSERVEGKRAFFENVSDLVGRLKDRQSFFDDLQKEGGSAEIIVHLPGDANAGSTIGATDLAMLAKLGIDLGIEVFPDMN